MLSLSKINKLKTKKRTNIRVGPNGERTAPIEYEHTFTVENELFLIHKYRNNLEYSVTNFETGLCIPFEHEAFKGIEIGLLSVDDTYQSVVNICEHKGKEFMSAILHAKNITIPNIEFRINGGMNIIQLVNIII